MKSDEAVKLFGLNNLVIESDICEVGRSFRVDFGGRSQDDDTRDEIYYPQFSERLRREAGQMSSNYAIFYCLENSIRDLIAQRLQEQFGDDWWEQSVPENVRKNANSNMRKEIASGFTLRSSELIDFTNFGELGEIIKNNWNIFGDMFRDVRAVEKVLATLNTLRAPIAHCKALAEDEQLRLHLGLRDWFRQME